METLVELYGKFERAAGEIEQVMEALTGTESG
jgi:hypothetical protein